MTMTREDYIVAACSRLFWSEMARPPESRVAMTRSEANDLLFSCLLNRQVSWEAAMGAISELKYRTGYEDSLHLLLSLSVEQLEYEMFEKKPALHRYRYMAGLLKGAAEHLYEFWSGDARAMWRDEPTASILLERVKRIKGMGDKTGNLFCRISVLQSGVQLWDGYGGILPSCDVHVRRVGAVLGLWDEAATVKVIEAKARELSLTEPVVLDALFLIGIEWHGDGHRHTPKCDGNDEGLPCPVRRACPTAR